MAVPWPATKSLPICLGAAKHANVQGLLVKRNNHLPTIGLYWPTIILGKPGWGLHHWVQPWPVTSLLSDDPVCAATPNFCRAEQLVDCGSHKHSNQFTIRHPQGCFEGSKLLSLACQAKGCPAECCTTVLTCHVEDRVAQQAH